MSRKLRLSTLVVLVMLPGVALAGETVTLGWDPPTHTVLNNDCGQQGAVLTPADLERMEYTVSYRVKGAPSWTNIEADINTVTLDLSYSTTYEASVGAHWPGGPVLCATPLIEFVTDAEPAPGACTAFGRR